MAQYDPTHAPHQLSGMRSTVSLADFNTTDSAVSQAPESGLGASASTGALQESDNATRASAELKRMWQGALRTCKAADTDKSGFVSRTVFIDALEKHLGKVNKSFELLFVILCC